MTEPLTILMNEHRMIERVMDALINYVDRMIRKPKVVDQGGLFKFVDFFKEFADRSHHGKEEEILFRVMVEHGFPREGGPIAVMLAEHDQGRGLIRRLKEIGEKTSEWSNQDRELMKISAGGFVSLLRQHIQKEDQILYPMAQSHLPVGAMEQIAKEFAAFEAKEKAQGRHDRLHNLGEELWEQYEA